MPTLILTKATVNDYQKVKHATILIKNYKDNKNPLGSGTACVYFDLNVLKQFIAEVERTVGAGLGGVRAYLGMENPSNLITVVFVGTKDKNDVVDVMDIRKALSEISAPAPFTVDPLNHGELCPPNTGCGGAHFRSEIYP